MEDKKHSSSPSNKVFPVWADAGFLQTLHSAISLTSPYC